MAQFEDYLEKKKQKQLIDFRGDIEQKQLKAPGMEIGMDSEQLINYYQSRIDNTTFKERTAYYFEDARLMGSKARRYLTISKGGGGVEQYAKDHVNHSADKRKKSAKKATQAFVNAGELILKYKKKPAKDAYETFTRREQIMRLRMEGMEAAAETKSVSAENELYLKSKAKISCLMVLFDQIQNLRKEAERTGNTRLLQKFDTKEREIQKELIAVQRTMKENLPTADEKWREENGLTSREVNRATEQNHHDTQFDHSVPVLNPEEMALKMEYQKLMITNRKKGMDFPAAVVRLDRNGQPITQVDAKKLEWNKRYQEAASKGDQATVEAMKVEALKRIESFDLPELKDLKGNDILAVFRHRIIDHYEMMINVPKFIAEEEKNPEGAVCKYLNEHPALKEKTKILAVYHKIMQRRMQVAGIDPENGDYKLSAGREQQPQQMSKVELRQFGEQIAGLYRSYYQLEDQELQRKENEKEKLSLPTEAEENAELAHLRTENQNPNLTMDSYRIYKEFLASNQITFRQGYDDIGKAYLTKVGLGNEDVSRSFSSMLRSVHYDKNGKPVSAEDKRLQKQNDRWMNSFKVKENETAEEKAKREAIQQKIIEKEVGTLFGDFELPEPKNLKKWFDEQLRQRPFELAELLRRTLAFDVTAKFIPALAEYRDSHPEFTKKLNVITSLNNFCTAYATAYYGVKAGFGKGAAIVDGTLQTQSKNAFYDQTEVMNYQYHLEGYTKNYNQYTATVKENENAEQRLRQTEFKAMQRVNPDFDEESYRIYREYINPEGVTFRREYLDKAAKIKEKTGKDVTIGRELGVVLRSVRYKNGKPATMKDMRLEKENMRWLAAWEENDEDTKKQMIKESLPHIFDGFTFPKPGNIEKWVKTMLIDKPHELKELFQRNLAISNLANEYPEIAEYEREHPEWAEKEELVKLLNQYTIHYVNKYHHIKDDGNAGTKCILSRDDEMDQRELVEQGMVATVADYETAYRKMQENQKARKAAKQPGSG